MHHIGQSCCAVNAGAYWCDAMHHWWSTGLVLVVQEEEEEEEGA